MSENYFSERLKKAMNDKNIKQVDIIRAAQQQGLKLGKSHISQYVSGKTIPRENILSFLAEFLEVDAKWLCGRGTGTENAKQPDEIFISERNMNLGGIKMREFSKSSKLDNVLYDVRGPVVEEANRMEEAGTKVLKLNIGNPAPFGFSAPDEVIYDMRSQLTECEGYSASKGLFSARKAIMQYMQNKNVPNVTIAIDAIRYQIGYTSLLSAL